MPWYYAGPEAKPVGPVSLEELHARRISGVVTADTYVIEHTGQQGGPGAWRRYWEIFPQGGASTSLPPVPATPASPPPVPSPTRPPILPSATSVAPPLPAANPLFPSGAAAPVPPPVHPLFPSGSALPPPQPVYVPNMPGPAPHASPHGYYPVRRTNACCAWGFGLGIAGFVLSPACGIGLLLAAPALLLCIVGFAQAQQRHGQSGRGLAGAGALLAILGLLISIGFLAYFVPLAMKEREDAARQQSSE